jgi:hypothetical protein
MKNLRLSKVAGAMVLALGVTTSAFAADTSSAIRGKITTPTGEDGFYSAKGFLVAFFVSRPLVETKTS